MIPAFFHLLQMHVIMPKFSAMHKAANTPGQEQRNVFEAVLFFSQLLVASSTTQLSPVLQFTQSHAACLAAMSTQPLLRKDANFSLSSYQIHEFTATHGPVGQSPGSTLQ